jgi:hypothetical protein
MGIAHATGQELIQAEIIALNRKILAFPLDSGPQHVKYLT